MGVVEMGVERMMVKDGRRAEREARAEKEGGGGRREWTERQGGGTCEEG